MHPEIERLSLPELVEQLDDVDERKTPVGWSPEDAVLRAAIERRIMELVTSPPETGERRNRLRVPCDLRVQLANKELSANGTARDIGIGGVFVETGSRMRVGTPLRIEVLSSPDERGLKVRGEVAWTAAAGARPGVGVKFTDLDNERQERHVRRFVVELLRHRIG